MPRIGGQLIPHKTVLLISSEALIILSALLGATLFRLLPSGALWDYLHDTNTIWRYALVIFVCEISFYYNDLYDMQIVRSRSVFAVHLLESLGFAFIVLAAAYYMRSQWSLGRGIAITFAPTILILIIGWRYLLEATGASARPHERILIVGTGAIGQSLVEELQSRPEYNYELVGILREPNGNGETNHQLPVLGTLESVRQIALAKKVDRIILTLNERRGYMPFKDLLALKFGGLAIEDPHTFYERITGRVVLDSLNPSWFILSDGFRSSRFVLFIKRSTDIVAALLGLIIAFPIMVVAALAILLDDGFPIIFRQQRTGLHGSTFEILKYRSMKRAPEDAPPSWTANGDDRITKVGQFIRKTRIDELPQLINVLRGDMSLVGPRPEQPVFCDLLDAKIPFYSQRHTLRPGLTGWAQVNYRYGASIEESRRKLEYDLFYVKHMSWSLDLVIILQTIKVVLFGRGAK
jgi:sugar transferase (PEP-CTERM system associated)